MNDVILYSGGLDSFLTHFYLNFLKIDHDLLYFDLGGKYSINEVSLFETYYFKKNVKSSVTVSDCIFLGEWEREDAYIPNRNLITAIMANSITSYDNIWIGGTLSDRVNDNNREVFDTLSNLLSKMHNKTIKISSPFWDHHKPTLVKDFCTTSGWGQFDSNLDAQKAIVNSTFSCYYPEQEEIRTVTYSDNSIQDVLSKECLKCPACFRKCMSLYAGGIFIPMQSKAEELVNKYYSEASEYIESVNFNPSKLDDEGIMFDRMFATVKYCERLLEFWRQ